MEKKNIGQHRYRPQQHGRNWFIVNLFGESGSGKSTILNALIEMLRKSAKYCLEVSEGFQTRDRRAMLWYCAGRRHDGLVSVCTMGDLPGIVKSNVDFFSACCRKNRYPWGSWLKDFFDPLSEKNANRTKSHIGSPMSILVTASHNHSSYYIRKNIFPRRCKVLDIPVRVDGWYGVDDKKKICKWTTAVRATPELLLFHIDYILRKKDFRKYSDEQDVDAKKILMSGSQD